MDGILAFVRRDEGENRLAIRSRFRITRTGVRRSQRNAKQSGGGVSSTESFLGTASAVKKFGAQSTPSSGRCPEGIVFKI